eukprot:GHVN01079460.1.p1 GENE.GHVN01079460.1~~GHVN01079460.1.p1  ORF type:complete len:536 (-),score=15.23 GHVN01079460.1:203-1810(-)
MELHFLTFLLGFLGYIGTLTFAFYWNGGFEWEPTVPLWPTDVPTLVNVVSHLVVMVSTLPAVVSWGIGFVWLGGIHCKHKKRQNMEDVTIPKGRLSIRVCTKGSNVNLVRETTCYNVKLLEKTSLPWLVEVVTDNSLGLKGYFNKLGFAEDRIHEIVVPDSYVAPSGCQYKARALNYALQDGVSDLTDDDFIVHLDEETKLDDSCLVGIAQFLAKHPDRIGQGIILYGRDVVINPLTTVADSIRVSDDYCRFRVCFTAGNALQGMHGSYVVVNAGIERQVTFDFGPAGSITEDAVFALAAMQRGVKFGFIDGVMLEKSPFTFMDFLKQRRRWLQGLWLIVCMKWLHVKNKFLLAISVFAWSIAPLGSLAFLVIPLVVRFIGPSSTPLVLKLIRTLLSGTVSWVYIWGSLMNFSWSSQRWMYPVYVILTTVTIPLCWMLETLSVAYALLTFRKSSDFYVVQKEYQRALEEPLTGFSSPEASDESDASRKDFTNSGSVAGTTTGSTTSSSQFTYERLNTEGDSPSEEKRRVALEQTV